MADRDREAAVAWMRRYDMSPWCHPRALEDLVDLLAAERAAATAAAVGACAEAIPGGTKKGVEYRARIRALSPEGWCALPVATLERAASMVGASACEGSLDVESEIRAALARGKGE